MVDPEWNFEGDGPGDIRLKAIRYLKSHRNWYAGSNLRFGLLWNGLRLGTIVLSALTAILAALKGRGEAFDLWVVGLPAASALCSTVLLQFRILDMWQLRDEGRLAAERLVNAAYQIPVHDRQAAFEKADELRLAAFELELDQSRRFFLFISGRKPS